MLVALGIGADPTDARVSFGCGLSSRVGSIVRARLGSLVGAVDGRTSGVKARAILQRAVRARKPIVAGPWLSEVGFEILYWRPFLTWAAETFGLDRDQLIVITRGGAGAWYSDIAATTIDVFERREPSDLRTLQAERLASRFRSQKQLAMTDGESALLDELLASRGMRVEDVAVLHPSAMYLRFKGYWDGWRSVADVRRATTNRGISDLGTTNMSLPDEYVAAKVYFSDCFPDTERNREFATRTLRTLSARTPVVLLSTGMAVDDHEELSQVANEWLTLPPTMEAQDNLRLQSAVLAGARSFVGTYGGFSYLAPYLGVPSFSFYSEQNFIEEHLDVMRRAVPDLRRDTGRAVFVAQHCDDLDLATAALPQQRGAS